MDVRISLQDPAFSYLAYIPKSEIVWSDANSTFNLSSNFHTVFQWLYIPTNNVQEFQFLHILIWGDI